MANFNIEVIAGDEQVALQKFVRSTVDFLAELANLEQDYFARLFFEEKPFRLCVISWQEFRQYANSDIEILLNLGREHIRAHALEGIQLQNKILMVDYYYSEYTSFIASELERPRNPIEVGFIGRRLIRKTLDSIDTLLESLYSGLPGGGAVIEMKKMFETAVRD